MRNSLIFTALLALILLSACNKKKFKKMLEFLGKERLETLLEAEEIQVYHIASFPEETPSGEPTFAGYPILAGPVEIEKEQWKQLQAMLADDQTYLLDDEMKSCVFTPNIGLEFKAKKLQGLQLLMSFDCNVLRYQQEHKEPIIEDFDPGRDRLLAFFKPFFADEAYFQQID